MERSACRRSKSSALPEVFNDTNRAAAPFIGCKPAPAGGKKNGGRRMIRVLGRRGVFYLGVDISQNERAWPVPFILNLLKGG